MTRFAVLGLLAVVGCGARSELDDVGEPGTLGANGCTIGSITSIFLATSDQRLLAFDPTSASFLPIDGLSCATGPAFSMAVDRAGVAFVEMRSSDIYTADTNDGACEQTPFVPIKPIRQFGMAFSADTTDSGETLFVATNGGELVTVDTTTFATTPVGTFSKPIGSAELTGTPDGSLFAFGVEGGVNGSHLARIDKTNAAVLSDQIVDLGIIGAWAFANWGDGFYFFTSDGAAPSQVTHYTGPGTATVVATAPGVIVGAGVSTCSR